MPATNNTDERSSYIRSTAPAYQLALPSLDLRRASSSVENLASGFPGPRTSPRMFRAESLGGQELMVPNDTNIDNLQSRQNTEARWLQANALHRATLDDFAGVFLLTGAQANKTFIEMPIHAKGLAGYHHSADRTTKLVNSMGRPASESLRRIADYFALKAIQPDTAASHCLPVS